jgi:hypothetical protein
MALVALLGMASALIRIHLSLAALTAGVSSMAFVRTCEKIDRSRSAGRPMGWHAVVEAWLASVAVAFAILGASLLPAIVILLIGAPPRMHEIDANVMSAIAILSFTGLPIAIYLRRRMW